MLYIFNSCHYFVHITNKRPYLPLHTSLQFPPTPKTAMGSSVTTIYTTIVEHYHHYQ
ncbi:hypothetical protein HanRHA438_Chr15g0733841 [Helianthus annuus]|nr:hypothetical protein HanRHA438_Chr15g0733841 [Helianthus annuus]